MHPHLRMEKILALIEANPGITGQQIAEACTVPWPLIQKDLETVLMALENPIPLYTGADEDSSGEHEGDNNFGPHDKWFLEAYTRKNVPLHLTVGEAVQVLGLPHAEPHYPKLHSLKQKILASMNLDDQGTYRFIKGNITPVQGAYDEVLLLIEKAIRDRRQIGFTYKAKASTADPQCLVYYSRLRQWYLAAREDGICKTFNLSKMQGIKELGQTFTYPADFSLRDWLAPHWGVEFGEPMKIKVRFRNRSQTMAKVRKDLAYRQCVLTEENGGASLLYEDAVIGRNEFIAWILGFGSAAEVLEPLELRKEIIGRIKASLANYK